MLGDTFNVNMFQCDACNQWFDDFIGVMALLRAKYRGTFCCQCEAKILLNQLNVETMDLGWKQHTLHLNMFDRYGLQPYAAAAVRVRKPCPLARGLLTVKAGYDNIYRLTFRPSPIWQNDDQLCQWFNQLSTQIMHAGGLVDLYFCRTQKQCRWINEQWSKTWYSLFL